LKSWRRTRQNGRLRTCLEVALGASNIEFE
jgi:hypothetical protein